MSKLAIFLYAVLVASAVNASYMSDALVSVESTVGALIGTTIYATKHKFDDIKSKAKKHVDKLEAAAKSANENAFLQVKSTLEEVRLEIDKLARKDDGSEINDFNKLVFHLEKTGFSAIVNMSGCFNDKLVIGRRYVQNIITLTENILANLTAIREEARHCVDNVDDIKTTIAAIECIDVAGLKAVWVETKAVPSLAIEMTKITNSLASLQLAPIHCEITSGFDTFFDETTSIFIKIHRMRHAPRPGTEEVTTEKALSPETTLNTKDAST